MSPESLHTGLKSDRRLVLLEKVITQHQYQKESLLEILHKAQELYGYLDKDLFLYISNALDLPSSHVYGVATFYNLFKLKKPGTHTITFCLGTACFVKGVEQIISAVERAFNVERGETSADGRLSLFITRCIGACAMAPNVIVDDEVVGGASKEAVMNKINFLLGDGKVETR
ncbi:MAG: NAD(P)H-dependent oxidoreductase subunit E [Candidatus Bathyarchaeota archaeon]|nr:NAD(P)H-dependent oxidoreductase subunit E [Candidatus Bathyarchaeota archaeon]MDH5532002.1 NAD(P)H-dependent oxidoreductase subunit E [Candidatus Bathyarchaeota archaeon]MDH5712955.1 NAD(P)H-dependent oxidoreductase subunit E [Candidatus Bathyarchaeota archaeon]